MTIPCCRGCTDGPPAPVAGTAAGSRLDTRGRVRVEPGPQPNQGGARSFDRNYDVQAFTGYPTSTVAAGQWYRGTLVREVHTPLMLAPNQIAYDPTKPEENRPAGT